MTSKQTGLAMVFAALVPLLSAHAQVQTTTTAPPTPIRMVPVVPSGAAPATAAAPKVVKPLKQPEKPVLAAKVILADALKEADATGKVAFVEFSASWCGWCHKLEAFLKDSVGAELNKYAVIREIIVQENGDMILFNNPGSDTMMKGWGGGGGIPFYVFLDAKGNTLSNANGMKNGGNIGYPANEEEYAAFDEVLRKGVPKLPADLRARMMDYIKKHP